VPPHDTAVREAMDENDERLYASRGVGIDSICQIV
jgi:hypothetical protein